jgi:hypothetical protein
MVDSNEDHVDNNLCEVEITLEKTSNTCSIDFDYTTGTEYSFIAEYSGDTYYSDMKSVIKKVTPTP